MRRGTVADRSAILFAALGGAGGLGGAGCSPSGGARAAEAVTPAPACPREAVRSTSGRCACTVGHVAVLGACLPPRLGDLYCGPAAAIRGEERGARADEAGLGRCVFLPCPGAPGGMRDVVTGECVSAAAEARLVDCGPGAMAILEEGRAACVSPAETCPRGTARVAQQTASVCVGAALCPPGSLPVGAACRPVVVVGEGGTPRVDVGSWAAIVLGADGGTGSEELCRPLALRPGAFGLLRGSALDVRLRIGLVVPDQDIARVHAELRAGDVTTSRTNGSAKNASSRPLPPSAEDAFATAMAPLIEALRGLGGESSTAAVDLSVRCAIANR